MFIAIDVGNTNTVIGVFDGDEIKESIRISTDKNKTSDEYEFLIYELFKIRNIDISKLEGGIISSVVPILNDVLERVVKEITKGEVYIVGPGIKTGLNILYDDPKEVGADRIVNAVGAIKKYGYPLVIIDFGTANTYCVVDENKNYLGGIISPGIGISAEALFLRAAKLPKVELRAPSKFSNSNTVEAIQAGLIYGAVGEVEYLVKKLKEEHKIEKAKVIATGGLAHEIEKHTKVIDIIDYDLTLFGLKEIYEKAIKSK